MNATFFALAFLAALNPKLFAVDLLLVESQRPRLMFVCFLAGGLSMCLAVGLLDVFVLRADAVSTQASVSAGLDLALGVPLVAIGALLATGRLHPASTRPAASTPATRAFGLVIPTSPMSRAMRGSPRMMCQSYGLSAAACTRTSTSPAPASGGSVSTSCRTSGGPNRSWTIAFIRSPRVVTPCRGDRR
jgi:hypothetical protein